MRSMHAMGLCVPALLLAGCVQTQATRLGNSNRPPVPESEVRVYRTAESIGCAFEEVAMINAQGSSGMTNESQMVNAAKKRAGRVGANAVIMGRINEPSAGAKVAGAFLGYSPERRGEMLAVYVFDPCRPVQPAGQ